MTEVQCPHCEKDIELEDDSFGLFDCPYCDEEFEYESSNDNGEMNPIAKLKGLLSNSTPKQRVFTFFFILGASIFGTNPFLLDRRGFIVWEGFVQIWLISFLADVVFILTMTISFLYVWKLTDSAKTKISYFLMPLITPFVVFIGYAVSWFFICLHGANFASGFTNGFFQFMFPIWSPDFEGFKMILLGYNGLIFTTIYTAIVVFIHTDTPKSIEE